MTPRETATRKQLVLRGRAMKYQHQKPDSGCPQVRPDPASPCGYWVEWGIYERTTVLCGYPGHTDGGQHLHPYVPTLCATCHHPIVEATDA